jgi:hypothetical protein
MAVVAVLREPLSGGYQGKSIAGLHGLGEVDAVWREPLSAPNSRKQGIIQGIITTSCQTSSLKPRSFIEIAGFHYKRNRELIAPYQGI